MLSIIVPTYNSAKTIKYLIKSIEVQNCKEDYEVIFIDNLSLDNTKKIIYNSKISDFSFFSQKDKGIYDAINYGVKKAKNDWIWILGSDDVIYEKTTIKKILKYFSKISYNTSAIYGTVIFKSNNLIYNEKFSIQDHFNKSLCQQSIIYKKKAIYEMGFFENKYITTADYVLNIKLLNKDPNSFFYINLPLAIYNDRGASFFKKDKNYLKESLYLRINNLGHYMSIKDLLSSFFGRRGFIYYLLNNKINDSINLISILRKIIFNKFKIDKKNHK